MQKRNMRRSNNEEAARPSDHSLPAQANAQLDSEAAWTCLMHGRMVELTLFGRLLEQHGIPFRTCQLEHSLPFPAVVMGIPETVLGGALEVPEAFSTEADSLLERLPTLEEMTSEPVPGEGLSLVSVCVLLGILLAGCRLFFS